MQYEITNRGPLLDKNGELIEKGFARSLIRDYSRAAIKAAKYRIKEWDYYLVANDSYALALTVADNSYMGLYSVSLLDFDAPWYQTTSKMAFFTGGKTGLPSSSASGDVRWDDGKGSHIEFLKLDGGRRLTCAFNKFKDGKPIEADILLTDEPCDSMVIATPFAEDKKAFYYNQKINCMRASGNVSFDGRDYRFSPQDSFGVLDWGRGVWTYKNTWYWGSASGLADGVPFGFNIGYGFGDTSAASENMLFYDGHAHKLEGVSFNIPQKNGKDDFMSPWTFTSTDGRFEMKFEPIIDRVDVTDVLVIASKQHQVFGRFTGSAVLDDGTRINVQNMLGFAEKVMNKW